ncbi:putative clathrin assembly protein At5g57200 isoform X3 [Henckelia pumila]|uniref:putative clathrin assembly protein At5g57200 isoform X3 n=1 Tax=Henckelia pumila TaxID=405737 RepID=UPI003C6DEFAE
MESFRKAYGALKDSTKIGLATIKSDFKDLDIAIIKATNHDECPPKERHVRKILVAVSVSRPRADVAYCIYALSRRLAKTRNWIVAIKTLIVFHRTLREADPSFREEILRYSQRRNLFHVSKFKDFSTWDCSVWVRTYGLFLEERLECFRTLNYDVETDEVPKSVVAESYQSCGKVQMMKDGELLRKLPALQQLLHRTVDCQPQGVASHNFLVQYAAALVLKESFKIYCTISDGITKLIAKFFKMPKNDAIRVLDIYRRSAHHTELLVDFYKFCKTLALARTSQFPVLRQLPPSFLETMEKYVKEAPLLRSVPSNKQLEYRVTEAVPQKSKGMGREEIRQGFENDLKKPEFINHEIGTPTLISSKEPTDLIASDRLNPKAVALDQSNALALAIIESDDNPRSANDMIETGSGWELALVTAPSNMNSTQATDSRMAGGFDKLLLDSLYEDNVARRQIELHRAGYSSCQEYETTTRNTLTRYNPFDTWNDVEPRGDLQSSMMPQLDQQMFFHDQDSSRMMLPWNPYAASQQTRDPSAFGGPFIVSSGMGNHALL